MGQYTVTDGSDQFAVRADHNPNILAMHGEAVVPNKRVATTAVGRRAGNLAMVGFREDPHRLGGGFERTPFGEDAADRRIHACTWVPADHGEENHVDRGCPEGPSWLYAVVGPAGRDGMAAQAEEGRIDDDNS